MTTKPTAEERRAALEHIIEQAETLSHDFADDVIDAVRLAAEKPLDPVRAERLWTRILTILRTAGRQLDDAASARVADEVRAEVRTVVDSVSRPPAQPALNLRAKYGVEPYDVAPIPFYNGVAVAMRAGYVDVGELSLWKGNHRLELHVAEFTERNHREPEDHEVLAIMQGTLHLPSLTAKDPFAIASLAESIARKGVERPPILTAEGQPKDGNRRIAAAKYVLNHPQTFTPEQIEKARWIRVWQAPQGTPDEMFEAIVVSQNFEPEHKLPWPEYVKARLVNERWESLRDMYDGRFTEAINKKIRSDVAAQFAIGVSDVRRYLRMVKWAEDFESYHVDEKDRDPAEVRYRANDIFQWFYEIDAGRGNEKLTTRLDTDDELKAVVYDLMFDVLDSGALVRNLHKMVADDDTADMLIRAHDQAWSGSRDARIAALEIIRDADNEVRRRTVARRKIAFDQWLRNAVEKLGNTTPDDWDAISETPLLIDVRRVFVGTIGALKGVLDARRASAQSDDAVDEDAATRATVG